MHACVLFHVAVGRHLTCTLMDARLSVSGEPDRLLSLHRLSFKGCEHASVAPIYARPRSFLTVSRMATDRLFLPRDHRQNDLSLKIICLTRSTMIIDISYVKVDARRGVEVNNNFTRCCSTERSG